MTEPIRLAAIVGSLRADSMNRAVFVAASALVGDDVELHEASVRDVPFYDGDVEAEGDPASVAALKQAVAEADGLLIFTPEYNHSVPALTKNAIDWLSRTPGKSVLNTTPVGVVAATPGRHDAGGVRAHLAQTIGLLSPTSPADSLGIASINHVMVDGAFDAETEPVVRAWLDGFVAHVAGVRDTAAAADSDDA